MCAMMVPCAFTPSPIETIVLLASDNCQFLCFAFFFFSVVILRNYNNLFSIVWFRFLWVSFLWFCFFFIIFTTSGYDSNFIYKNACVCVLVYLCNDFQHCFGIKFYMDVHSIYRIRIVIDLVGINLNRAVFSLINIICSAGSVNW